MSRSPLHPSGAALARLLGDDLRASALGQQALLPELALDRFAVELAERAELDPSAAFVALDLCRLGKGTRAHAPDPRAVVTLLLLLLSALELGSTRLAVGSPAARAKITERLEALSVGERIQREVLSLLARISGAEREPPKSRNKGDRTSQLELGLAGGSPSLTAAPLPTPLFAPVTAGDRAVLRVHRYDGETELALSRWADAEDGLREALIGRRTDASPETVLATLAAVPPLPSPQRIRLTEEQSRAVSAALLGPTTLITGGPGTGKTSIVVAMLRGFLRRTADDTANQIAIAAPTGKAADRLREAIGNALAEATDPRDLALAQSVAPMTLHRLLGYQPDMDRYRHHAGSRLPHRLVVVDEASMLDTMLFCRLVEALGDDALLVLLGDPDQLPSVGAGAVLRDLPGLARKSPAALRVAHLTQSHRMSAADPAGAHVLSIARAIGAGTVPGIAQVPEGTMREGVFAEVLDTFPDGASLVGSTKKLGLWLDRWLDLLTLDPRVSSNVFGPLDRPSPLGGTNEEAIARAIEHAHRSRLLVVTRGPGPRTGLHSVNQYLGARHAERSGRRATSEPLAGEPVVVTANDYLRGIYNGDTGLVVDVEDGGRRELALALTQRGRVRLLPMLDVQNHIERAWALTVHRAQGSEHERVALLLPEVDVPRLLTREIVYTAITRARRAVQVVGDPALLATSIVRKQERRTGLSVHEP